MEEKFTLNQFVQDYEKNSSESYGFFDWFCKDTSLKLKAKEFVPKLKFLLKLGILDGDNCYVWFKNNAPVDGQLYDDFRISVINDEHTYLGGIAPSLGYNDENKGKCSVFVLKPIYSEMIYDNWTAFKKELQSNPKLVEKLKKHFETKTYLEN